MSEESRCSKKYAIRGMMFAIIASYLCFKSTKTPSKIMQRSTVFHAQGGSMEPAKKQGNIFLAEDKSVHEASMIAHPDIINAAVNNIGYAQRPENQLAMSAFLRVLDEHFPCLKIFRG
eukprot:IDg19438t1